ncbi:MAG: gamma-glutamylcyclotransferase family protein [Pseudomonadota bacterium]
MPSDNYILNLAYGSNLHRGRISARVDIQATLGVVRLPDWGLRFHKLGSDDSGKCNLISAPGEVAYGFVYAFSAQDKQTLDEIEGVGKGYRNVALSLATLDLGASKLKGDEEVFAYLAVDSHINETLIPYDWYHGFVRTGAEQCDFPHAYLEHIDQFEHRRDPDESRRAQNFAILNNAD